MIKLSQDMSVSDFLQAGRGCWSSGSLNAGDPGGSPTLRPMTAMTARNANSNDPRWPNWRISVLGDLFESIDVHNSAGKRCKPRAFAGCSGRGSCDIEIIRKQLTRKLYVLLSCLSAYLRPIQADTQFYSMDSSKQKPHSSQRFFNSFHRFCSVRLEIDALHGMRQWMPRSTSGCQMLYMPRAGMNWSTAEGRWQTTRKKPPWTWSTYFRRWFWMRTQDDSCHRNLRGAWRNS